ncbi:required for meiotic nuclear division protein 1 homolog [Acanthaster planci]|uniref:Required for meiotic nuclear division protein 1 homolog n=1 Tax=Acanthaster planci TaxID=133434 RepID=A0A8B7ZHJ6_ACAPL|nr:required for meiotic nuclear division protein 1 homolog [Acanthaster planci]XP_022105124.1 required for meiotic nuclear division protein 1 homolog [Acanthaster planci]
MPPLIFRHHQLIVAGSKFLGCDWGCILHGRAKTNIHEFIRKNTEVKTWIVLASSTRLIQGRLCRAHGLLHQRRNRTLSVTVPQAQNSRCPSTSVTHARSLLGVTANPGWGYLERTLVWRAVRMSHTKGCNSDAPVVFVTKTPAGGKKSHKKQAAEPKSPVIARPRTKKPTRLGVQDRKDFQGSWLCTAFSTAEEYHLEHLGLDLQSQGSFLPRAMPQDAQDVLLMEVISSDVESKTEPSEIFFFREGSVVFWNVADATLKKVLRIVSKHEFQPYEVAMVAWENEHINYSYGSQDTKLTDDTIILDERADTETTMLEKFAFSNAMALSVKLGVWESSVDKFTSSLESIPESLKQGHRLKMSRVEVMRKTGELFSLRHQINLSSDLLISPDFYWDRDNLDELYNKTCHFYSIGRRTRVINEKLNHCSELVELMRTHLSERHSLKLEWMIILLIGVEVMFEVIHYIQRYYGDSDQHNAVSSTPVQSQVASVGGR